MASAWHSATGDKKKRLWNEIAVLAGGKPGEKEREIAGYAVKHICQRAGVGGRPWFHADVDAVRALIRLFAVSPSAVDRMVAGEALLAMAIQGGPDFVAAEWLGAPPDELRIWQAPYWANLQEDVDAIRVIESARTGVASLPPSASLGLQACTAQWHEAQRLRRSLLEHPLFRTGPVKGALSGLRPMLMSFSAQQNALSEIDDNLRGIETALSDGHRQQVLELVQLIMLHPLWNETERGSNLVSLLIKRQKSENAVWLLEQLLQADRTLWRLSYGAVDAAFTSGSVDGHGLFRKALLDFGCSEHSRVRGICADDLHSYLDESDKKTDPRLGLLADEKVRDVVRLWVKKADDIWLIEYVHLILCLLWEARAAGGQELLDDLCRDGLSQWLDVADGGAIYLLPSDEFLGRVEARRRSAPAASR